MESRFGQAFTHSVAPEDQRFNEQQSGVRFQVNRDRPLDRAALKQYRFLREPLQGTAMLRSKSCREPSSLAGLCAITPLSGLRRYRQSSAGTSPAFDLKAIAPRDLHPRC